MLVGRVVHNQVDKNPDAVLLGGMRELDKIANRAERPD
jgi:hypothetical protein